MNTNIGKLDQLIRISLGVILLLLTFFSVIGIWGLVGFIPLLTGVFCLCPLYSLLKFNSQKFDQ